MNIIENKPSYLRLPLLVLSLLFIAQIILIHYFTEGHFYFSLDDPYIFLALSENISKGHYGVNISEYSAPASSILWPILLLPLTLFANTAYLLLALNILFSFATVAVAAKILWTISTESEKPISKKQHQGLLLLFILLSNVLGLAFTGMEHNLQLLLALIIFYGLLVHVQTAVVKPWLLFAIIIAPFVRYECLTLSGVALLYLMANKIYARSLISGTLIALLLISFSVFLLSLNLSYLPDSILAKSSVAASGLEKLAMNVLRNLSLVTPKGIALLLLACYFFHCAWFNSVEYKKRVLAFSVALAIVGHLLIGRIGWYFRYEIYLWTTALCLLFYIRQVPFLPKASALEKKLVKGMTGFCLVIAMIEHTAAFVTTPLAASNIYHQQAQMQRFIKDFYKKPVAVNDLGLASYQNDLYVLDLWGLGSSQARILRKSGSKVQWMDDLAEKHHVGLAMIYHDKIWFEEVPASWIKLGQLEITGVAITARFPVSFFAMNEDAMSQIEIVLDRFIQTLPAGSRFIKSKS